MKPSGVRGVQALLVVLGVGAPVWALTAMVLESLRVDQTSDAVTLSELQIVALFAGPALVLVAAARTNGWLRAAGVFFALMILLPSARVAGGILFTS